MNSFDQKRADLKDSLISGFIALWEVDRHPSREMFLDWIDDYVENMRAINNAEGWFGG